MELSAFHFHSYGLVSNIKKMGESEIKVIPIEYSFGRPDAVFHNPEIQEFKMDTSEGVETISLLTTNSITAKWFKLNSNRITPPDVRRNDKVMILRNGETDDYYWMDCNTANVKRLETVVWAFSADPKEPIAKDLSNAYRLELSTHNKTITLHTSKANEEPFEYAIQINADDGIFTVTDDVGNTITLNSRDTYIKAINKDKSFIDINKKDILIHAEQDIKATARRNITMDCKELIVNASKKVTFTTPDFEVNAESQFNGNVTISKKITAAKGIIKGAFETVSAKVSGVLEAVSATFKSHGPH